MLKILHLCICHVSYFFSPLFGHKWHYFLHSNINRKGAELLKFKLVRGFFFSSWRHLPLVESNSPIPYLVQILLCLKRNKPYPNCSTASPLFAGQLFRSGFGFLGFLFCHFWFYMTLYSDIFLLWFHALFKHVASSLAHQLSLRARLNKISG